MAVRDTAKTQHNSEEWGTKPCGLHPYCSNKLSGGEDIGLVYIVSPVFHPKYERTCWCCWHHVEASLAGMEVQTQLKNKGLVTSTPKNSKTKRTGLSNAPIKKTSKKPRTKTAPEDTDDTTNDSNDEK